jgi:hypothetical protein
MTIILVWIISILSFLIGYFIGKRELTVDEALKWKKTIEKKFDTERVGVINRPTAKDLRKKENPVIEEGKKEFGKLLDKIIKV